MQPLNASIFLAGMALTLSAQGPLAPQALPLWTWIGEPRVTIPLPASGPVGIGLGDAVASAGDVNGDGCADVILLAPLDHRKYATGSVCPPFNGAPCGSIRVMSGATGDTIWRANGIVGDSWVWVASGGDIDGDGVADVMVGANQAGTTLPGMNGYVRLFSGVDTSATNSGTVIRTITSPWTLGNGRFGHSVANAGDLNCDGVPDQIVGDPGVNGGFSVHDGSNGAVLKMIPSAQNTSGCSGKNELGWAVTGLCIACEPTTPPCTSMPMGDVDGDNVPDVAVGARFQNNGTMCRAGSVEIYSGAHFTQPGTPSPILTLLGPMADAEFGFSLSPAGDVDGGGIADLVIGAKGDNTMGQDAGSAWVIRGEMIASSTSGSVLGHPAVMRVVYGSNAEDRFGFSVGGGGDVNGDNMPDVIVGAPQNEMGTSFQAPGLSRVFSGADVAMAPTGPINPLVEVCGENDLDYFGEHVAFVDDMDGDGRGEVLVGGFEFSHTVGTTFLQSAGQATVFRIPECNSPVCLFGNAPAIRPPELANVPITSATLPPGGIPRVQMPGAMRRPALIASHFVQGMTPIPNTGLISGLAWNTPGLFFLAYPFPDPLFPDPPLLPAVFLDAETDSRGVWESPITLPNGELFYIPSSLLSGQTLFFEGYVFHPNGTFDKSDVLSITFP